MISLHCVVDLEAAFQGQPLFFQVPSISFLISTSVFTTSHASCRTPVSASSGASAKSSALLFASPFSIMCLQTVAAAEYKGKEFFMDGHISLPHIVTHVKIGNFILDVYAYRPLNSAECQLAVSQYMRQCKLKKLPSHGSGKVFTQFGSNPEDDL